MRHRFPVITISQSPLKPTRRGGGELAQGVLQDYVPPPFHMKCKNLGGGGTKRRPNLLLSSHVIDHCPFPSTRKHSTTNRTTAHGIWIFILSRNKMPGLRFPSQIADINKPPWTCPCWILLPVSKPQRAWPFSKSNWVLADWLLLQLDGCHDLTSLQHRNSVVTFLTKSD